MMNQVQRSRFSIKKKKKKCQEIKYSNDRVPTFNIAYIYLFIYYLPIDRSQVFEERSAKKSNDRVPTFNIAFFSFYLQIGIYIAYIAFFLFTYRQVSTLHMVYHESLKFHIHFHRQQEDCIQSFAFLLFCMHQQRGITHNQWRIYV